MRSDRKIEAFVDGDTKTIRLYTFGTSAGAPCVEIPIDQESMLEWIDYLWTVMHERDDGDPVALPGWIGVLTDEV